MKEELLKKMMAVVDETMTAYKSDFYKYDLKRLVDFGDDTPEFLWSVRKYGTTLRTFDEKEFVAELRKHEAARFCFMHDTESKVDSIMHLIDWSESRVFLYYRDSENHGKLVELTGQHDIIRDAAANRWHHLAAVGKGILHDEFPLELPFYNTHIPVHFAYDEVFNKAFNLIRQNKNLLEVLKRFRDYKRTAVDEEITIGGDFMENSFTFSQSINGKTEFGGGIIYDDRSKTWEIHT